MLWLNKKINFSRVTPQKFREHNRVQFQKLQKIIAYPPEQMHHTIDRFVKTDNYEIPVRIYKPIEANNLPILMFFHGGGFVVGSVDSHDNVCRRLAMLAKCLVISVEYRLAPEFKYPIPIQDCYAATAWAAENAQEIGGDANRIAVCGDSAGGCLATVVSMMAKEKAFPKIIFQALIYPCTDGTLRNASIDELSEGYLLTKEMMQWFLNHYKNTDEEIKEPYFSPLLADDVRNLPPALIITAEYDPLKDEGRRYAEKLKEAGVPVQFKEFKGMIHVFFQMPKFLKKARQAQELVANELKSAFGTNGIV